MINTRLTDLLGMRYPVFQGAMAWISDGELAAAVSEAGGIGIIAGGNAPASWVRDQILRARELTDRPFGVNVMLMSPYVEEVAALLIEEPVAVITTGAGNAGKYMKSWQEVGSQVIPVVPSVALARRAQKEGAAAVIAEGGESGGHIGELNTMALVPQAVDAVDIPVLAAGGIGDGRGVAAALMLGAEGVQMGTRFIAAKECTAHQNYKNKVLSARDIDTTVTGGFTGYPVRVLRNQLSREMEEMEKTAYAHLDESAAAFERLGAGALRRAVIEGDVERGSVMAGQIAGLVRREQTCAEIVAEMMAEFHAVTRKLAVL